ncbi:sulfotransferase [Paracoccus laeviglucosivorans]|uniref:Sulfotransferase family protein n=1 Tax=Paracoccus laeviglucosivorans TaxID=1197861 RepID=A0A521BTE4_9RHOB|nr:sulfotransferase [Paracoccus laeviglucosivorans]SMO50432.1 Sulfotransferase family protein [Paracoccus laeviglucosivorans]
MYGWANRNKMELTGTMLNFDHAFIMTYGRSGSTLLQGLLNTIPDAEIRGENGNALFVLFLAVRALRQSQAHSAPSTEPTHPWYGASLIDYDSYEAGLISQFKANVMPPSQGRSLTGFKEIRYQTMNSNDLGKFLGFVRKHFPRTAFIINTRDLDEVVASNARAKHQVSETHIRAADENFRHYAQENPDHAYHVHYDDYIADPSLLDGLFEFLGAPLDQAAVTQALATTHSVRTK